MLLDDILSALDVHTAKWIVDKCLQGEILKGRTVIMVTHNIPLVGKHAGLVVSISAHGEASTRETIDDAMMRDPVLKNLVAEEKKKVSDAINESTPGKTPSSAGKLVADEEVALGHVNVTTSKFLVEILGPSSFLTILF